MKKYKVTINDKDIVKAINDKIAIDSLFSVGETITNSPLLFGDNYTDDERIYNSVLEYKKEHKEAFVFIYVLDNFTITENSMSSSGNIIKTNYNIAITDNYIQVDGYRMKFKEKFGYTYMLRKTFIGTDDVTRFAGFITESFWKRDALKIIHHILDNGKLVSNS